MHIITSDGKIVEGQELTTEEANILKELIETGINSGSGTYIATSGRQSLAHYLVTNFEIRRRQPPPAKELIEAGYIQIEAQPYVEPPFRPARENPQPAAQSDVDVPS
jgi:hypothetical protein